MDQGFGMMPRYAAKPRGGPYRPHKRPANPRRGPHRPPKYQPNAPVARRPPTVVDRGVLRARECPCTARLFLLTSNDIATGSAVGSAVLGVPAAATPESILGTVDVAAAAGAVTVAEAPRPVATCMVWADTPLLELAMEALRVSRQWADAAYADAPKPPTGQSHAAVDHRDGLPLYCVELLFAFVDSEGKAVVRCLGTVALRQVLPDSPELMFPARGGPGSVDCNAVAVELGFSYGNPILFTCTRLQ